MKGCEECPKSEDVWLEAARLMVISAPHHSINKYHTITTLPYHTQWWLLSHMLGTDCRQAGRGGYVLRVRCVRCLKVAKVLDSMIAADNSFQMVGAEKQTKFLLKLTVQYV